MGRGIHLSLALNCKSSGAKFVCASLARGASATILRMLCVEAGES